MSFRIGRLGTIAMTVLVTSTALAQDPPDLVARARAIHQRVLTLDTHVDINPANFTNERSYATKLPTQMNLPAMEEGGLDAAFFVVFVGQSEDFSPEGFAKELTPLPNDVKMMVRRLPNPLDLILLFVDSQKTLSKDFAKMARKLANNGMLWIAWPKQASGVATDLSENIVRQIGLDAGLVDVKVCAVNDIWSGLKFVYRLKDRQSR